MAKFRVGDRVMLRERWRDEESYNRDRMFGPNAHAAVGTVIKDRGDIVNVLWDDPTLIESHNTIDVEWSEDWLHPYINTSSITEIENYLNGRNHDTSEVSR